MQLDLGSDRDAKDALSKLLQMCTVAEYQDEFEMLINRVTGISESLLTSFYISGLKLTLQIDLLRARPTTLGEAFSLACKIEARFEAIAEKEHIIKKKANITLSLPSEEASHVVKGPLDANEDTTLLLTEEKSTKEKTRISVLNKPTKKNKLKTSKAEVDLPDSEISKVCLRFAPEPNEYVHIGHGKTALMNQQFGQGYNGIPILRFDDINSEKESNIYVHNILKDVDTLRLKCDKNTYTLDYFPQLIDMAQKKKEKVMLMTLLVHLLMLLKVLHMHLDLASIMTIMISIIGFMKEYGILESRLFKTTP
nr:glutamate--tRNA ligase, cytoplasmic [Tanacetum cinerariifolium]